MQKHSETAIIYTYIYAYIYICMWFSRLFKLERTLNGHQHVIAVYYTSQLNCEYSYPCIKGLQGTFGLWNESAAALSVLGSDVAIECEHQ